MTRFTGYSFLFVFVLTGCATFNDDQAVPVVEVVQDTAATHLFIGTYTRDEGWVNGKGEGIYSAQIQENGELSMLDTTLSIINPSFITISSDQQNLYAVSELGRSGETGFVYAYEINEDLSLTYINRYSTNAGSPAHVSINSRGEMVFVANYQGGVAMVYSRNEDGSLKFEQQLDHTGSGPHPNQGSSHIHQAVLSPDQNYLYLPDLGSDRVWIYRVDYNQKRVTSASQGSVSLAPGAGPRHMAFDEDGEFAYVMNELNSTITVYDADPQSGDLQEIQTISTLPSSYSGANSTADIHITRNGNFLYGSNRGHNSIVGYFIDEESGLLSLVGHTPTEGDFPRNFGIDPLSTFMYVANQNSDNITIFSIDEITGELTFTGEELSVPTPVCVVFY